jgi:hypothetical protein
MHILLDMPPEEDQIDQDTVDPLGSEGIGEGDISDPSG